MTTSSPSPLPILEPLDGTSIDYTTRWRPMVFRAARTASHHEGQLHFEILFPDERLATWPPLEDGVPGVPNFLTHPGPPPPLPPNATQHRYLIHIELTKSWNLLRQERTQLFNWVVNSIPLHVQRQIPNFVHLTEVRDILAQLHQLFGRIYPRDLQALYNKLQAPYVDGTPIGEHLATFHTVFHVHDSQNTPLSPYVKYTLLLNSMQSSDTFAACLQTFNLLHPHLHDDAFEQLATALRHAAPTITSTTSIAQVQHKKNKPRAKKSFAPTPALAITASPATAPANTAAPVRPHYCHTHGQCFHPSHVCTNRGKYHNPLATHENHLGGSDRIAPLKDAQEHN